MGSVTGGLTLATLCTAEQEEEATKGNQGEQDVAQQSHVVALLVALGDGDVNTVPAKSAGQQHSTASAVSEAQVA
jgi:hypothetical protein